MPGLNAIMRSADDKSEDGDKLLNLYWNRAELKKQFAEMRNEKFQLRDRMKQQEGATARLQQKIDHVEDLLTDPKWVFNVAVFYQLRGLAVRCQRKLEKFAEQLKQQRERKQHDSVIASWNEKRKREAKSLERQALLNRDGIMQLEDQLQSERHRLSSMSGFMKVFRRRSLSASLEKLARQLDEMRRTDTDLTERLLEIRNRKPPDNEGLVVATKRSINLMILAFAQQLFLGFEDHELAVMAREAGEKSVGAINYGGQLECQKLLARINKRLNRLEETTDFADVLQKRAKLIGQIAQYVKDSDAVPIADSVATLFDIDGSGSVQENAVNIAGRNYWGISKAFSR